MVFFFFENPQECSGQFLSGQFFFFLIIARINLICICIKKSYLSAPMMVRFLKISHKSGFRTCIKSAINHNDGKS